MADRFTALYRKYLKNSCTGPENASNSPLDPSPATKRDSSPFNRLLRMWGNRKTPSLRNEMSTYFILSPQGTMPTIHSPLVEEHPIQQTLKTKYRSFNQIPGD
ncbi:hypothetical protein AVEN_164410-1 [Araneus ventricosus]|uniref:Uncharacterized protein n=1 Tax=Araneus ventricosus TaxID=182803 RepID=A0A4Y2GRS3_ARAVE|nr:hypothetical protein AVEN_164410-1 [Araneus ventricosus]